MHNATSWYTHREPEGNVVELVLKFHDIFVGTDGNEGFTDLVKHEIDMEGTIPVKLSYQWKLYFEKEHIMLRWKS